MKPDVSSAYRSYEDYDTSARFYDDSREALGVDVIVGLLATRRAPLSGCSVLDVGCGTGNYVRALADHVGRVTGLEYSPGMLARAHEKTAAMDPVALTRGSAFGLPFAAARFDAVLFTQVVHHFDTGTAGADQGGHAAARPGARFPMLRIALEEAMRVLAPGGLVILNHMLQRQIREGFWWSALIPDAMERMSARYIPVPELEALLADIGFEYGGAIVPLDAVLQAKNYLDLEGPLREQWRRGESTWTLATDQELAAGLAWLRAMIKEGTAPGWLAEREALRRAVGQTVFIHARRPRA